jgi:hypothetical protein
MALCIKEGKRGAYMFFRVVAGLEVVKNQYAVGVPKG